MNGVEAPLQSVPYALAEEGPSPMVIASLSAHEADTKAAAHSAGRTAHAKLPWMNNLKRPRTSPGPRPSPFLAKSRSHLANDDPRRDSGMTAGTMTTTSTAGRESPTHAGSPIRLAQRVPTLPAIVVSDEPPRSRPATSPAPDARPPPPPTALRQPIPESSAASTVTGREEEETASKRQSVFQGITTSIPTGSLDDLFSADKLEFSKRGSVLLGGKRANGILLPSPSLQSLRQTAEGQSNGQLQAPAPAQSQSQRRLRPGRQLLAASRILSADEELLSRRVRSMYEHGDENAADWALPATSGAASIMDDTLVEEDEEGITEPQPVDSPTPASDFSVQKIRRPTGVTRSPSFSSRRSSVARQPNETAGGIEDWQDVDPGDVNRYGFIQPRKVQSRGSSAHSALPPPQPVHRVTTALQMASDAPRRRRTIRRAPSVARSSRTSATANTQGNSRNSRHQGSIYSNHSGSTTNTAQTMSPLRYASNRLPHNRERRWMDEAADMLTAPPGLADIEAAADDGKNAFALKKREWEREEKWRRMGKVTRKDAKGGGMVFDFDTRDAKLINRTWKGIPDRWRATAWYAFLAASAKKRAQAGLPGGEPEELLKDTFHEAQTRSSVDDMQIDVDVPRTINSHIMFRRRYRGGQRLLFRVLHALSLYLQDQTEGMGYVQGMAALVATLLCYYDEENAFVMMVRLWNLRGLEHFYRAGFGGLMEVLGDFERDWLAGNDVAQKLKEFGIEATAYGTRWYLTLFNYSIPFPAQLRVWDVFMLLGDAPLPTVKAGCAAKPPGLTADLDVLHATSAALVDATREIILDSDFENAMKVLTSWIPVKDEEILMRVARAEYRQRRKKAGKPV